MSGLLFFVSLLVIYFIFITVFYIVNGGGLKSFILGTLKLGIILMFSFSCFYIFGTPLFLEAAFAEGTDSSNAVNVADDDDDDVIKKKEVEETEKTFLQKIGDIIWNYKWYILSATFVTIIIIAYLNSGSAIDPGVVPTQHAVDEVTQSVKLESLTKTEIQSFANLLNNPELPADTKIFVENISNFSKMSIDAASRLPQEVCLEKVFFGEAENINLTGTIITLNDSTIEAFRVYPATPTLLSASKGPFLYGYDPSTAYWISHAKSIFPALSDGRLDPLSFTLQYHKIALVDPINLTYTYYHQIDVLPTNVETLSTPFETHLSERVLKAFIFKDNEAAWSH